MCVRGGARARARARGAWVCVCACARVRVPARVCACARGWVRACARARVCMRAWLRGHNLGPRLPSLLRCWSLERLEFVRSSVLAIEKQSIETLQVYEPSPACLTLKPKPEKHKKCNISQKQAIPSKDEGGHSFQGSRR